MKYFYRKTHDLDNYIIIGQIAWIHAAWIYHLTFAPQFLEWECHIPISTTCPRSFNTTIKLLAWVIVVVHGGIWNPVLGGIPRLFPLVETFICHFWAMRGCWSTRRLRPLGPLCHPLDVVLLVPGLSPWRLRWGGVQTLHQRLECTSEHPKDVYHLCVRLWSNRSVLRSRRRMFFRGCCP